jgi:amino acid adenylation domain-containing protein
MHAVFCVSSPGLDIEQFLVLALELRRNGHSVSGVLLERYKKLVPELETAFLPLSETFLEFIADRENATFSVNDFGEKFPATLRELTDFQRSPGVLISPPDDPLGSILCQSSELYHVTVHSSLKGFPVALGESGPAWENATRRKMSMPLGTTARATSSQLAICAVSRHLLPESVTLPESVGVTGFLFFREDAGTAGTQLESHAAGPSTVLILLTETANPASETLVKALIEGVCKSGGRALLRLGEEAIWAKEYASKRVEVDFSSSISSLLSKAELVIHHGDAQVSAEVFRAGVPAVIVPCTLEQRSWAELARAKGCARNVIPAAQLNAVRLARAIQGTLGEPDFRRRAAALAKLIAEEKGASAACGLIEELVTRNRSRGSSGGEHDHAHAGVYTILHLKPANRAGPLPLSFAQERLWFLSQLDPGSSAYNMPLALRLKGQLSAGALQRTVVAIVSRHEILRTVFTTGEAGPKQEILSHLALDFEYDPAGRLSEAEALKIAREEAEYPFDLERGPLIRVKLLRLGELDHVLLLNLHHIVSDGWSVVVLMREITVIYRAYLQGRQPELPELAFQYADFAVWQREWLQGEILEHELAYWRGQLAGSPALELATDYPRKPAASYRAGSVRVCMPPALLQQLKKTGQSSESTLFIVLMAAFHVALSKYSGQRDLAVGTAIAYRNRKELEAMVGFFVNTLVLRTSLDGDPALCEVLKRVKRVALDAYRHQDLPFEKLVQDLQPERIGTGTPFIQAMMILENTGPWDLQFESAQVSPFMTESGAAKLELTLSVREENGALVGELVYARDLYAQQTVERLVTHWQRVLERMVAEPDSRVSDLCMLDEEEREQLLFAPNRTETTYPVLCVHAMIEKQVKITPDSVAVEFESRAMTYGELNRRANRVARFLKSTGVGIESRVGVCLYRGLDLMPVLLGILKSGAAYVPLDPGYPPDRLAYMLQDSDAALVLTGQGVLPASLWNGCRAIDLDKEWSNVCRYRDDDLEAEVLPENLAYVIYTSGSTGKPKGVEISHAALSNFLFFMLHALELTSQDVVLAETPLSFDIAGLELYLPLCAGAQVRLLSRAASMDAVQLIREMNERVTLMQATPATWQMVMDAGWKGSGVLKALCGGEALPLSLASKLVASSCGAWNMYGPTETTIWSLMEKLERGGEHICIGKPLANTQVYVLDDGMLPVPMSVPGELYLGGAGLARSYWRRPELTAERFVPNPFHGAGERLYRTGDRVRWRPGGKLEFLDRADYQVKVRGHRIELGEIESVLNECENVRQGVAVVREGSPGEKYLAAYVLAQNGHKADTAVLKSLLRKKLPEYMVPGEIVWMEDLPLTPNGKIDRKRLPSPAALNELEYVAPRDAEEELLCLLWAEVLNRPRVGVTERFFDLGGHSLLATQVTTKLRSLYNIEIPLQAIFEAPTIAELAERVRVARTSQPKPSVPLVKLRRRSAASSAVVDQP